MYRRTSHICQGVLKTIRDAPRTERELRNYVRNLLNIEIADAPVCREHQSPWAIFSSVHLQRPSLALILGPRGGGKSFLSALDVHLTSRFSPGHSTRILGGSLAQSEQMYRALCFLVRNGCEEEEV